MANRWKGNIIAVAATTSSGTDYTGKANGAWGLNSQLQQKQGGLWAKGVSAPSAPTNVTAAPLNAGAIVSFTESSISGGGALTYTATSTPSGISATLATSPITVYGLSNGTSYTFTVHATNDLGYISLESNISNNIIPSGVSVLLGTTTTPYLHAYAWANGFGSKYADPSSLPNGSVVSIAKNTSNNEILVTQGGASASPYIIGYPWTNSGFGAKYANPSTLPTSGVTNIASFNYNSSQIAFTSSVTPFIYTYSWTIGAGFGTKYVDPVTLPPDVGRGVAFNISNTILAVGHSTTPFISFYNWSFSGFGTKLTDTVTLADRVNSTSFISNGSAIFMGMLTTPFIAGYAFSTSPTAKYADPSTLPSSNASNIAINSSNNIAVSSSGSLYLTVYQYNSGFGAKYANPNTLLTSGGPTYSSFTNNNDAVVMSTTTTPFISAYSWNTITGFGSKFSNPITLPSATFAVSTQFI